LARTTGRRATVEVCIACDNQRGRRGRRGRRTLVYAYLGPEAVEPVVGAADLPGALRHRDELPADEPGTHPDLHARPAGAAVVRGPGVGAAQRVGLPALRRVVDAAARQPGDPFGTVAFQNLAGLATACRRIRVGPRRRHRVRTAFGTRT